MERCININSEGEAIFLKANRYRIYILGGFGVSLGQFLVSFKNKQTHEITKGTKASWPVQAFDLGKRAKRILVLDILKEGEYEVLFRNPETIRVKRSNLLIISMFSKPLKTENIEVLITTKTGIWPILR